MSSNVHPPNPRTFPSSLSILYLGQNSGTSHHRAQSFGRLGHKVRIVDPHEFLPASRLTDYWIHHTGALGLAPFIHECVLRAIKAERFDVAWVDGGALIAPELVCDLKQHAKFVVNYNIDDPYGTRDAKKWRLYLDSVPLYDLVAVVRDCNVPEAYSRGAKSVMRVHRSSDEIAHAPRQISDSLRQDWSSEVLFVGTWMPERGPFFARLVQRGIPLTIWGDRWTKADEWSILRPYWRGPGLYRDENYAMAIQCAKVCVGMLSKGNRDLCTTRSFEIPHLGSVLCAERTAEHLTLYEEEVEAVFWSDPDECAEKCTRLLKDAHWRNQVARSGQLRHFQNGTTNQLVMSQILSGVVARQQPEVHACTPEMHL